MGEVGDKLDALEVRVLSPDGDIKGKLTADTDVDIVFKNDRYYRSTSPETLAHQLGRVLTLLAVGRVRERQQILEAADFEFRDDENQHWDKRVRRFHEARANVTAAGHSPGRKISIATVGLRDFRVRFDKDLTRRLDKTEFIAEFRGAVAAMVVAYSQRMVELKTEMLR